MAAVIIHCSKVSIQLLHCLGEIVGFSLPKVNHVAFQVISPALEVVISFGLQAWLVLRLFASVLFGLGDFPLFPFSRFLKLATLR